MACCRYIMYNMTILYLATCSGSSYSLPSKTATDRGYIVGLQSTYLQGHGLNELCRLLVSYPERLCLSRAQTLANKGMNAAPHCAFQQVVKTSQWNTNGIFSGGSLMDLKTGLVVGFPTVSCRVLLGSFHPACAPEFQLCRSVPGSLALPRESKTPRLNLGLAPRLVSCSDLQISGSARPGRMSGASVNPNTA